MRHAASVTELSRNRIATRSRGVIAGSVSPATRGGVGVVTSGKVAPTGVAATGDAARGASPAHVPPPAAG